MSAYQVRENTEVRRTQIVDAARKIIVKYGSEHVTIKRIASEVRISEANIYRHFKSKRQILTLLVENMEEGLLADLATGAADAGGTPIERLDKALRNQLTAVEQRRGVYFQVIAEIVSFGDKRLNRKVTETIAKYVGLIKDILVEAVKAGEVRGDINPQDAAELLFGAVQGLVNTWALSNYSFDLESKFLSLWDVYRKGIAGMT